MKTLRLKPEQYPALLRQIEPLPDFLDCAGALPPSTEEYRYLCVVGSRRHSDYGRDACLKLIGGLKGFPIVIVSGLAIGIDSIAHEAALDAGLRAIAFPGSGLDRSSIYPQRHLSLAEKLIESGNTLLSPFERDNPGTKYCFAVRNRLMAGISHATLIIEGRPGSGTLITARNALEFGRDVLIVPGSIFSELSYGPHLLFRDGAIPVFTSEDILSVLGFEVAEGNLASMSSRSQMSLFDISTLPPDEKAVIQALERSAQDATELSESTGISALELNILISKLELKGLIVEHQGIYRANIF